MKRFIFCIVSLLVFAMINSAIAAPPEKANILHCGCVVDPDGNLGMAFLDINVSSKAKGHAKHGIGDIDTCFDGLETFADFQRTANDCWNGGAMLPGLVACVGGETDFLVGDECGMELLE